MQRHQLQRLGPDARADPITHLGGPDAGDGALRNFTDDLLYLDQFGLRIVDRRAAQVNIDAHASVVDAFVDVVGVQLVVGQLALRLADRPHGAHVLLAIGDHLGHERRVVVERPVSARDAQRADERAAPVVLLHRRAGEAAHVLQRAGRAVGARLCCGAIELLQRRFADAKAGGQDVPEDQPLEGSVVRPDLAGVVSDARRERLAGRPRRDRFVIERPRHAQDRRAGVLRVIVDACGLEVAAASALEVKPENGHVNPIKMRPPGGGPAGALTP